MHALFGQINSQFDVLRHVHRFRPDLGFNLRHNRCVPLLIVQSREYGSRQIVEMDAAVCCWRWRLQQRRVFANKVLGIDRRVIAGPFIPQLEAP